MNAPTPANDNANQRFQLSLKSLFLCVTYFAVASLMALRWGAGLFVVAMGIFLTWLSYRGFLWWLQTQQNRPKAFVIAWMMLGASLALPAVITPGCGNALPTRDRGWVLAINGVYYTVALAEKALELKKPELQTFINFRDVILAFMYAGIINLPNVMMLLSPWLLYRQQRANRGHWPAAWGCAAVSTWMWAVTQSRDLLIGYYIWSSAVLLIFLTRPIGWRTLLSMAGLGVIIFAFHWFG